MCAILYAHTSSPMEYLRRSVEKEERGILRKGRERERERKRGRGRGREERRRVFTFQISRLTRTVGFFSLPLEGGILSPRPYTYSLLVRAWLCRSIRAYPGPSPLIRHKSVPDRTTVREFLISGRRVYVRARRSASSSQLRFHFDNIIL